MLTLAETTRAVALGLGRLVTDRGDDRAIPGRTCRHHGVQVVRTREHRRPFGRGARLPHDRGIESDTRAVLSDGLHRDSAGRDGTESDPAATVTVTTARVRCLPGPRPRRIRKDRLRGDGRGPQHAVGPGVLLHGAHRGTTPVQWSVGVRGGRPRRRPRRRAAEEPCERDRGTRRGRWHHALDRALPSTGELGPVRDPTREHVPQLVDRHRGRGIRALGGPGHRVQRDGEVAQVRVRGVRRVSPRPDRRAHDVGATAPAT